MIEHAHIGPPDSQPGYFDIHWHDATGAHFRLCREDAPALGVFVGNPWKAHRHEAPPAATVYHRAPFITEYDAETQTLAHPRRPQSVAGLTPRVAGALIGEGPHDFVSSGITTSCGDGCCREETCALCNQHEDANPDHDRPSG